MKQIWLGGVAEEKEFKKMQSLGNLQVAANNMQLLYIRGLEKISNSSVKIINSHFYQYYPQTPIFYLKRKQWIRNNEENIDVGYINLPIIKQFMKAINVSREIKKVIKEYRNEEIYVYIYSMTTPLMYASKTIRKCSKKYKVKVKIIQIVPDLPEYMNFGNQNAIYKLLKKLDRKLIFSLTKYIDKYILFSKYMAEKLNIEEDKYITIEGMADINSINEVKMSKKENVIMYAGSINEEYGVFDLINAFIDANITNYNLNLYGPCNDENKLKEKIKTFKNIKYYGMISREKILELERNATLLVNPRKPNQEFAMYSFPSKTMEYLVSGTPVLMYKLKSIPKEYDKYLFYIDENKENDLKNKLVSICSSDRKKLEELGLSAQKFIMNKKSNFFQCKKILEFIKK